ncbi:MAG: PfkB family carbohydrate kinase [Bacteroidia bacterium]|nr:PfkB family carbohydrate kinase [Bacteroidia bacterium]
MPPAGLPAAVRRLLHAAPRLRVLVLGDLMLDRYLWGRVDRISPEAPVPVVEVQREEARPGGAANVALNVQALGAQVSVCGLLGSDAEGQQLEALLGARGFDLRAVRRGAARPTTAKTRILGNQQQMLRLDREDPSPLGPEDLGWLMERLPQALEGCHALIIEDYDKGLMSPELIRAALSAAAQRGIPAAADPKYRQFWHYGGCTLFKPNLKELNEALGLRTGPDDLSGLAEAVGRLRVRMPHAWTLVTLGSQGMWLQGPEGAGHRIAGHVRRIADVSGAGDTVIAAAALGLAAGLHPLEAASVANLAGAQVVEMPGVAPADPQRLLAEAERLAQ